MALSREYQLAIILSEISRDETMFKKKDSIPFESFWKIRASEILKHHLTRAEQKAVEEYKRNIKHH